MKKALIIFISIMIGQSAFADEVNVQEVLDCSAANGPEKTFSQMADFKTYHSDGSSRDMSVKIRGARVKDALNLNLYVENPASLTGTAILFKEREGQDIVRIFLPSIRRSQNVTGSMAATKMLATDFSYLDIKQLYGAFVDGAATYKSKAKFVERPAHEIEIVPTAEEASPYTDLLAFIDAETCVVLGVHFRVEDKQVLKKLEADPSSNLEIEGRHLMSKYTMHDLMSTTKTEVTLGEIVFDKSIPNAAFHPQLFSGAR